MVGHIVALGGGGFSMEPDNLAHDRPDFPHAPHQAYFLYFQSPYAPRITNDFTLLLHTRDNPLALVNALRRTVAGIDPNLPLTSIYPFDQVIYDSFASRRLQMTLVGCLSSGSFGSRRCRLIWRSFVFSQPSKTGAQRQNRFGSTSV
jgi:hypothetical protein